MHIASCVPKISPQVASHYCMLIQCQHCFNDFAWFIHLIFIVDLWGRLYRWRETVLGVGGLLTHHQAILKTPAGCPGIQLHSDTFYPEITSDSTGWGLGPRERPPTTHLSDISDKPELSLAPLTNQLQTGSSKTPSYSRCNRTSRLVPVLMSHWL